MTFPFSEICTLLSRLEDIELRIPPILSPAEKDTEIRRVTNSWFKSHRAAIDGLNAENAVAFLSTFLPERRPDRVYSLQAPSLTRVLSRCLGLSAARAKDLTAWRQRGGGDLGQCLERVLKFGGPPALPVVNLDEVDGLLALLAGRCRFSDPNIRLPPSSSEERDRAVRNVVLRLHPSQGKWLIRLILKDFSPVKLDDYWTLKSFHFLLPDLLRFQNSLEAALRQLKGPLKHFPPRPDPRSEAPFRQSAAVLLKPLVGVKVGRPNYFKARSIDACISMCGRQPWVLERKYDGEYCEIHIDMTHSPEPRECIKIFSKSGKDSTDDRKDIIPTLVTCMSLDSPKRKIRNRAILLGELVVHSDRQGSVLPFEKIRKHVSRSGVFLGTDADSLPHHDEHLAIVFFDLLLLDDEVVMNKPLAERRTRLREIYTKIAGRAMGAEWKVIDFRQEATAARRLMEQFAASIAARCEGLVLKPYNKPYFNLGQKSDGAIDGHIKLKKDYIDGMGDEADFAVVGASYDAQQALDLGLPNIRWTTFHLGCLLNKADVERYDARPKFRIVGSIPAKHCIPRAILQAANALGGFCAEPYIPRTPPMNFDIEMPGRNASIDTIFNTPFVFEVLGSGYVKPPNSNYFMLRHPRVKKLHQDRSWKECISVQELQVEAIAAREAPEVGESQETRNLIDKLSVKCKKKAERDRMTTPRSGSTRTPASSRRSRTTNGGSARGKRSRLMVSPAELDGTTLIEVSPAGVRPHSLETHPTPCPSAKKRRLNDQHRHPIRGGLNPTSWALSDITNTAPTLLPPPTTTSTPPPLNSTRLIPSPTRSTPTACSTPFSPTPQKRKCSTSTCLFSNAAVYAAPCIARTPYITHDLLTQQHDVLLTRSLAHWERDCFAYPARGPVVAESQAFAGMRKIVLVEGRRGRAVREVVAGLLGVNGGGWRERVEVWDWRVLESGRCALHEGGKGGGRELLGVVGFDEGKGRTVFVVNDGRDGTAFG